MADFPVCFNSFVLLNEAGNPPQYVPNADPTRTNPYALALAGINSAAFPVDYATIDALPLAQRPAAVAAFYQRTYWNRFIAQVESNPVAMSVMDAEVNEGIGVGVELMQRAVNQTSKAELATDGVWGPRTLAGINACLPVDLVPTFQQLRVARYRQIVADNPSEIGNLKGWIARATKPVPGLIIPT